MVVKKVKWVLNNRGMGEERMERTTAKAERLLMIYSRLVNGDTLSKQELAQQFHVTMRSIQRDMESLRCFFAEQRLWQDISPAEGALRAYR